MIEAIGQWLSSILEWAAAIPQQGWAILFGILFGGVITQWIKRTLPIVYMFPSWSKTRQVAVIRTAAFFFSAVPTYIIWPDDMYELWAACAVGFTTPTLYRMGSFFLWRKWPELEKRWSGTE